MTLFFTEEIISYHIGRWKYNQVLALPSASVMVLTWTATRGNEGELEHEAHESHQETNHESPESCLRTPSKHQIVLISSYLPVIGYFIVRKPRD